MVETNTRAAVDEIGTETGAVIEIQENIRAIRVTLIRGKEKEAPHQANITNRPRNPGVKC